MKLDSSHTPNDSPVCPNPAVQREVDELFERLAKLGRAYRSAKAQVAEGKAPTQHPDTLVSDTQGHLPS